MRIDLNADTGERFAGSSREDDRALLSCVTSANIACGFHAGDPTVMRETVRLAREYGVAVGAHPGFADLSGFGRREMRLTTSEIEDLVAYQTGALAAIAAVPLHHVKPHGALYNMAANDAGIASAIARAVASVDRSLILFGLAGSELISAAAQNGITCAREAFADRAYRPDGRLVSRREAGAVVHDPDEVVARALQMVAEQTVVAIDGSHVRLEIDTLCIHGDTLGAVALARRIRDALQAAGIDVLAVGR